MLRPDAGVLVHANATFATRGFPGTRAAGDVQGQIHHWNGGPRGEGKGPNQFLIERRSQYLNGHMETSGAKSEAIQEFKVR